MKNNIKSPSKGNFAELVHFLKCLAVRAYVADELNQIMVFYVNYLFVCVLLGWSSVSWRYFSFGIDLNFHSNGQTCQIMFPSRIKRNVKACSVINN